MSGHVQSEISLWFGLDDGMASQQILRVLLVEDSMTDKILISALLDKVPSVVFHVEHVESLTAAVDQLQNDHFDAVLLDLSLPDSYGLESCKRIYDVSRVPIVVLTGFDDEQIALQALQQGAQDYLVKGQINPSLLSRSLRYAIERRKGEIALQTAHDELERRKHQAELAHLARLNTMGEMASGMAHELNQPLTALVGYADSGLRRRLDNRLSGDELETLLQKIVSEACRAAEIIRRLRKLVQKRAPEQSDTDLNELVHEVAAMVEFEAIAGDHRLTLELANDIPIFQADRIQIQQVLLNLVRNGIEAMEAVALDERELIVRTLCKDRDSITVEVIDHGVDSRDIDLTRLFEPYYTTKVQGLGMGLAICRSIIEAHSGYLAVEPNERRGLRFTFQLPLSRQNGSAKRT